MSDSENVEYVAGWCIGLAIYAVVMFATAAIMRAIERRDAK